MAAYIYIITYLILASSINAQVTKLTTVRGKIKISFVMSSGCPSTHKFIKQIFNVYDKYKKFLTIHFIPWGRTKKHPNGSLTCPFGENECFANKVQRCALHMLRKDQNRQVQYMKCEFSQPYPAYTQGNYNCGVQTGLRFIDVGNCALGPYGKLDKEAEQKTLAALKVINNVPAVWFNDKLDYALHKEAMRRLSSIVCTALGEDPSTGFHCVN